MVIRVGSILKYLGLVRDRPFPSPFPQDSGAAALGRLTANIGGSK